MSDARWNDVFVDLERSREHFRGALKIDAEGNLEKDDFEGYKARMAFMHAMQSGFTSLENAMIRSLEIMDEARPTGAQAHADLVRRLRRPIEGRRPALFDETLGAAVDETRRFRHVARHTYDDFRIDDAAKALAAARTVADRVTGAFEAFRDIVDPDEPPTPKPSARSRR